MSRASLALLILSVGCLDLDPVVGRIPPEAPQLAVYWMATPDSGHQVVRVEQLESLTAPFPGARVRVRSQGQTVVDTSGIPTFEGNRACLGGRLHDPPPGFRVAFRPALRATYSVEISADGLDTARATLEMPGDFDVVRVQAEGDPPGTDRLEVTWRESPGAYRYIVTMSATPPPECDPQDARWYVLTADTSVATAVDSAALAPVLRGSDQDPPTWMVDVYALDEALFRYLTSGYGGTEDAFNFPPEQNVEGGFGVVGAYVRRSAEVPP